MKLMKLMKLIERIAVIDLQCKTQIFNARTKIWKFLDSNLEFFKSPSFSAVQGKKCKAKPHHEHLLSLPIFKSNSMEIRLQFNLLRFACNPYESSQNANRIIFCFFDLSF